MIILRYFYLESISEPKSDFVVIEKDELDTDNEAVLEEDTPQEILFLFQKYAIIEEWYLGYHQKKKH